MPSDKRRINDDCAAEDIFTIDATPHYHCIIKNGDVVFRDSERGQKAFPFALAEMIDNAISATSRNEKRVIDIYFLFTEANKIQNICFFDNGAYTKYHYDQASRQEAAAELKASGHENPDEVVPFSLDPKGDTDPLSFNGNIGQFGVGAKDSAFWMATAKQIITKKSGGPILELQLSKFKEKWEDGTGYKFHARTRKPGGSGDVSAPQYMLQHEELQRLWNEEKNLDSFSLFVLSNFREERHELKDLETGVAAMTDTHLTPFFKQICSDLSRTYFYYLAGATGLGDDDDSTDGESENSDDIVSDDESQQVSKKRTRAKDKDVAEKGKQKRYKADPRKWSESAAGNSSGSMMSSPSLVSITLHICRQSAPKISINLRSMHVNNNFKTIERLMLKKQQECFEFGMQFPLASGGQCKAVIRAYYFPKIQEKETRPVDEHEQADAEGPIFTMYWQGRWIPYTLGRAAHIFDRVENKELLKRIRGTMFFPRAMLPANNKLSFLESPEVAMAKPEVRVFLKGWGDEMQLKAFKTRIAKWLSECHEKYDRDITYFKVIASSAEKTTFERIKYGHRVYNRNDCVCFKKKGVIICGVIEFFICEGECQNEHRAPSGKFVYRRQPCTVFGNGTFEESVGYLRSDFVDAAQLDSLKEVWQKRVDKMDKQTPDSVIVLQGYTYAEAFALKLKPKELNSSHPRCLRQELTVDAGWEPPDLSVFVKAKNGKAISSISAVDKPKRLSVRLDIRKLTDRGVDGTDKPVADGRIYGGQDTTRGTPYDNACYWFNSVASAFEGAGRYELIFTVLNANLEWKANVLVKPGDIETVEIQGPQQPLRLGFVQSDAFKVCFRDKFNDSDGKQRGKGNVCFKHGQECPKNVIFEVLSISTSGGSASAKFVDLSLSISSKTSNMGWFDISAECTLRDLQNNQSPLKALKKGKAEVSNMNPKVPLGVPEIPFLQQVTCVVKITVDQLIISSSDFTFTLNAGKPAKLVQAEEIRSSLAVENKTFGPEGIKIKALDGWGHPVNVDEKGEPLEVHERIIYVGNDSTKKRREKAGVAQSKITVKADAKCVATFSSRLFFFENPPVIREEKHALEYKAVGVSEPFRIDVTVKPSKLPHAVRVHRRNDDKPLEMLEGEVRIEAPAGEEITDVYFRFVDEASDAVEIRKKDGWKFTWTNGQSSTEAFETAPGVGLNLPTVKARSVAGDTDRYAITFRGCGASKAKDYIPHEQTINVTILVFPVAGSPRKWSCVSREGSGDLDRPIFLRCQQPLREALRLELVDKHGNRCRFGENAGLVPVVKISDLEKGISAPSKEGNWDTFELVENENDSFLLFNNDACLVGTACSFSLGIHEKCTDGMQTKKKLFLVPGTPEQMRVSLQGLEALAGMESIVFTNEVSISDCPTSFTFKSITIQVTDKWENPIRFKSLAATLQFENGLIQLPNGSASRTLSKSFGACAQEDGKVEIKNVNFKAAGSDSNSACFTISCIMDKTYKRSAVARLQLKKSNRIIAIQLMPDSKHYSRQFRAGEKVSKLLVNLVAEDGLPYCGPYLSRNESISVVCARNNQTVSEKIFRDPYREEIQSDSQESASVILQPLDPLTLPGNYALCIKYTELRESVKANLMASDLNIISESISFTVIPGPPHSIVAEHNCNWAKGADNGKDRGKRCLAEAPQLVVTDKFGNPCSLSGSYQIRTSLQVAKKTEPSLDVCYEWEFYFSSDTILWQKVLKARAHCEEIRKKVEDAESDLKGMKNRATQLESEAEMAHRRLESCYAHVERTCGLQRSALLGDREIEQAIRQSRDQSVRLKCKVHSDVVGIKRRIVERFGPEEFVGLLIELIYFEEPRVAELLSWAIGADRLQTAVVRSRQVLVFIGSKDGYDIGVMALETAKQYNFPQRDGKAIFHRSNELRWLTDRAAVNLVRFHDPALDQLLRFNVAFTIFGRMCLVDTDLEGASNLRLRCKQLGEECPDLLCLRDGRRLQASGYVRGGARGGYNGGPLHVCVGSFDPAGNERLRALSELKGSLADWVDKRTLQEDAMPMLGETTRKEAALNDLRAAQRTAEREYDDARLQRTEAGARQQGGRGSTAVTTVGPGGGTPEGADGPMPELERCPALVPVEPGGRAKLPALMLKEGVGSRQGHYVLRFELVSEAGFVVKRDAATPAP